MESALRNFEGMDTTQIQKNPLKRTIAPKILTIGGDLPILI